MIEMTQTQFSELFDVVRCQDEVLGKQVESFNNYLRFMNKPEENFEA